ncbi:MAG: tripartite tricarboxylate transporter substrate-binding protein [Betaproteobacteria bacterium]
MKRALGLIMMVAAGALHAQNFPNRLIRVVTTEVGGASDLATRIMAQALSVNLGQSAIVENRGIIGVEIVSQATADGHVLLHYTSPLWIIPLFRANTPWDPLRDFVPIALTVNSPNLLAVHPSLPVKTVPQLVALAKARPSALNYASSSSGSGNHLAAELFKSMTGTKIERIAFKGAGAAVNAVMGGQIDLMFPTAGSVTQIIKQGRLRALAVTSLEPSAIVPGLPTMAQAGVPGYESQSRTALFAPAKTPPAVIARIHAEVTRALNQAEVRERLFAAGLDVIASTPQEAVAVIKSEMARMSKLIDDAGLRE